jgi:hypothetical protein
MSGSQKIDAKQLVAVSAGHDGDWQAIPVME